ncbi:hypothetical protein ACO0LO_04110 [Undibacterium sp. TJN25]|uniref:hypothetical protein n=1 Tax=Undibacterium sp. TJN25 TaxID=3413056 RepID=UPI003BF05CB3
MKVFQTIRDVLLGLLALLLLLALLPISASAQPLYHSLAGPTQQRLASLRLSPSLADATSLALSPSGLSVADGYRKLAQAAPADFSEMPVKPASVQAGHGTTACSAIAGFPDCSSEDHAAALASHAKAYLPDPSPWLMLLLGLIGIMLLRRQM